MQCKIQSNSSDSSGDICRMSPDGILVPHESDIISQEMTIDEPLSRGICRERHAAHAVCVEVVLVVIILLECLVGRQHQSKGL